MTTPINEHNMLTLDFWRDTVTYEGKTIPVGTMGCETLNIPDTVIERLNELCKPVNRLLEAMGATVRLNDDTAWDEENNSGTPDAVSSDVFNPDGDLTKSLKPEQTYTQRAGCTVNPGKGTWLVKGRSTTHGVDADGDGQDTGENAVLLACEELADGGNVYAVSYTHLRAHET